MPFDGTEFDVVTANLIAAKQVLIDGGWCIDNHVQPTGEHCAMGALNAAMGADFNGNFDYYDSPEAERLHAALPRDYQFLAWCKGNKGAIVANFNNNSSAADVLALFDRAINHKES